ncbi:MAG TPA: hypothetical protein VFE24_03625 [Pirellulales bacterium]|nr:hypothetical protein [Pirellulales bacterium]
MPACLLLPSLVLRLTRLGLVMALVATLAFPAALQASFAPAKPCCCHGGECHCANCPGSQHLAPCCQARLKACCLAKLNARRLGIPSVDRLCQCGSRAPFSSLPVAPNSNGSSRDRDLAIVACLPAPTSHVRLSPGPIAAIDSVVQPPGPSLHVCYCSWQI